MIIVQIQKIKLDYYFAVKNYKKKYVILNTKKYWLCWRIV